jgi:hypothetical protein
MQLVIVLETPVVRKAGGVIEQNAQGELRGARVAFEVRVGGEIAEGLAEVSRRPTW